MLENENVNQPTSPQLILGAVIGSASLTQAQIDEEEGWDDDDDDELLGYECYACGNVQDKDTGCCDECMCRAFGPWYG